MIFATQNIFLLAGCCNTLVFLQIYLWIKIEDFFCDYRHSFKNRKGAIMVSKYNSEILYNSDFINSYDYYLPICPENNMIYYNYVKKIFNTVNNINLSCTKTLLTTSDKLTFKKT